MRPIILLIALFAGIMVYSAHRDKQAKLAKARAAATLDSARRADSVQYAKIQAKMGQQAAAQLGAQQAMSQMAATRAAAAAGAQRR